MELVTPYFKVKPQSSALLMSGTIVNDKVRNYVAKITGSNKLVEVVRSAGVCEVMYMGFDDRAGSFLGDYFINGAGFMLRDKIIE